MNSEDFLHALANKYQKAIEISRKKNSDYSSSGGGDNAFENFELCEKMGICSTETGMLVRMTDKLARMSSLLTKGSNEVKDESLQDTCSDLANYATIMAVYLDYKAAKADVDKQHLAAVDAYEAHDG